MNNINNSRTLQESTSPNENLSQSQIQALLAVHDIINMSSKDTDYKTYQDIMNIADQLAPNYFGRLNLLEREDESPRTKEYRLRADKESLKLHRVIHLAELVMDEINDWREYVKQKPIETGMDAIKQMQNLEKVHQELTVSRYTENRIIERDMSVGEDLFYTSKGGHFLDIALPNNGILRLRLIHPDNPEGITGIDYRLL